MKSAGKARSNGLYRHIRTSKEIIRNLLNDCSKHQLSNPHFRESCHILSNSCNAAAVRCVEHGLGDRLAHALVKGVGQDIIGVQFLIRDE